MGRQLELDELVEHFTLLPDEVTLLRNKSGATRLGFTVLLKYFTRVGRFPGGRSAVADEAVEFIARQVGVPAADLGFYDWSGRQIKAHRAEIRNVLGFRECGVADADKLTDWLTATVAETERRPEQVRDALLGRCREERIEPPTRGRMDRMVASALHRAEDALFARVAGRLPSEIVARVLALVADVDLDGDGGEDDRSLLALIKADPGSVSLESMLTEIDKLLVVRAIALPPALFADVAPKVIAR